MALPGKSSPLPAISRRKFLGAMVAGAVATNQVSSLSLTRTAALSKIDRKALVTRHNLSIKKLDPRSPLSLGNGEFAFTADVTGLQTFPEYFERSMPLCTMAQWGWHTKPLRAGLDKNAFRLTDYDTHGRQVGYRTSSAGQSELYTWLRENPHRLHLGRIGLSLKMDASREAQPSDLIDIDQKLDLWTGILTSRFKFDDRPVELKTAVHPDFDLLAIAIDSRLLNLGRLAVRLAFPYGSPEMNAADWDVAAENRTKVIGRSQVAVQLHRTVDADDYFVTINWHGHADFAQPSPNELLLQPSAAGDSLNLIVAFSAKPFPRSLPDAEDTFRASARHWQRFWTSGAAVDLADSLDSRAAELERRVILSQYLTAIQCAGSMPPQETGLTVNSWYGKFHLEMHWWHAAHFALWNRLPLLERSLSWYARILNAARALAASQGYRGARWPKMVGPEGRDSPSPIGPLLIWQQPHPIIFAELCYLTHNDHATLERYQQIVFETAEFMASYAFFEKERNRYLLGPPVIPAQENHPPKETWNPTLELAYWSHGLRIAQTWRVRLGLNRNAEWDRVIARLSSLPVSKGVYLAHENCPQTFTARNYDHPSMLGAFGMLPGRGVDREVMRNTLKRVLSDWRWDQTWGWDYPLTAMTAARLGEPKLAVDALLMETQKNRFLANGHNWQRDNLPCYLPANGGLLYAVALMAAGWRGAPAKNAPGFPRDGSWKVQSENFNPSVMSAI